MREGRAVGPATKSIERFPGPAYGQTSAAGVSLHSERMGVRRLVADERTDLVAFLRTLGPDEWEAPSLCEGWRVRDVVAHLLYDTAPLPRYLFEVTKAGFSAHRMNARAINRSNGVESAHLADALERSIGAGIFATLAPSLALADALIHHQDIRRPLDRPRSIPPERVLNVLNHPDRFATRRSRTRGLRFAATDVSWSRGDGPDVRGTGEAIVMAIAGRPAALDELSGDGVRVLRDRLGSS